MNRKRFETFLFAFIAIWVNGELGYASELPSNLSGENVNPLADTHQQATVLLFVAADCPISNRYVPTMNLLFERFSPKGIKFWVVYPNADLGPEEAARHREEYKLKIPGLLDRKHFLVKAAKATVTPEVAVYLPRRSGDQDSPWIYKGRIDNQYIEFGKWRHAPTEKDLEEVLTSIVANKSIQQRSTRAVGCYISANH